MFFFAASASLVDAGGEAARAEAASVPAAATDARLQLLGGRGKLPIVPALRLRAPAVGPHAGLCRWVRRYRCRIDRLLYYSRGYCFVASVLGECYEGLLHISRHVCSGDLAFTFSLRCIHTISGNFPACANVGN